MGIIKEIFLDFEGYPAPQIGDHIRISCVYKGVVRDVLTLNIKAISECFNEPYTVLIKVCSLEVGMNKDNLDNSNPYLVALSSKALH